METSQLKQRLERAIAVAREAGAITLEYYGSPDLIVHAKADHSPVTEADRRAEKHIRQRLSDAFPTDGFLGEEFGEKAGTSGARWILDPIDGTKSFVRTIPLYGTLIGLEAVGQMVAGVVYMPALDELAFAAKGMGAWWVPGIMARKQATPAPELGESASTLRKLADSLGARPARVSTVARLSEAVFCTTSADYFHEIGQPQLFDRLRCAALFTRGWSDCYAYLLLATGRVDFVVDPALKPWDIATLKPIVEEAGGTLTDLAGNPTIYGDSAVCTNGHLFEPVMAIIRGGADR